MHEPESCCCIDCCYKREFRITKKPKAKPDMRTAEGINIQYAFELDKLNRMMAALSQQQDVVMDLHYKYVKAVTKATENA